MIEVVVKFDKEKGLYVIYEPTTETLFLTASLGESFIKLSQFLQEKGMIEKDILQSDNISYHIDSATFIAMVESNANLLKRLNNAPSGFTLSSQRFGSSNALSPVQKANSGQSKNFNNNNGKDVRLGRKSTGTFSKSAFKNAHRKFGSNNL